MTLELSVTLSDLLVSFILGGIGLFTLGLPFSLLGWPALKADDRSLRTRDWTLYVAYFVALVFAILFVVLCFGVGLKTILFGGLL